MICGKVGGFSTLLALVCLAAASPVLAQDGAAPVQQVQHPEWRILLRQATATFNAEFSKPDGEQNYKPVFAVLDKSEKSAARQFGVASEPHITVLRQRAVYLGLAGSYDQQLQVSKQLLKLRTADVDPNSLVYARALIQQTSEITSYNAGHKALGVQILLNAQKILRAQGPIESDELADAWYEYAEQMVPFGWERGIRYIVLQDITEFRRSQNPIDTDDYIAVYRMSGGDEASAGDALKAMMRYQNALKAAENDSRPEKKHLGTAQVEYGVALLNIGEPALAETYLAQGVETLTKPGSNAWPQFIQYSQRKLAETKAAKADKMAKLEAKRQEASQAATQAGHLIGSSSLDKLVKLSLGAKP